MVVSWWWQQTKAQGFFAKKDSRGCPESLWKKQKEWRYHYTRILEAKPIKLQQWQPSKAEIVAVAM